MVFKMAHPYALQGFLQSVIRLELCNSTIQVFLKFTKHVGCQCPCIQNTGVCKEYLLPTFMSPIPWAMPVLL